MNDDGGVGLISCAVACAGMLVSVGVERRWLGGTHEVCVVLRCAVRPS